MAQPSTLQLTALPSELAAAVKSPKSVFFNGGRNVFLHRVRGQFNTWGVRIGL